MSLSERKETNRRHFLGLMTASGAGLLGGTLVASQAGAQDKAKPAERPLVDSPPVLQCPTETGMTVVWAVGHGATGSVEFGTDPKNLNRNAFGDEFGLKSYHDRFIRVRIDGLRPNTKYYYRTATAPFVFQNKRKPERLEKTLYSDVYSFETPGPNKAIGTFSVINDTHNNQETLKLLMEHVGKVGSDYTVWNGDLASEYQTAETAVEAILRPGGAAFATEHPLLYVPGNHDYRGEWVRNISLAVPPWPHDDPRDRHNGRNFVVRTGPLALIGLDTGEDKPDWHPAWSGQANFEPYRVLQRDWLERVLRSPGVATAPFVVAFCHIPIYDEDPNANGGDVLENWAQFQRQAGNLWGPLLDRYGVQLLVTAHRHRFKFDRGVPGRSWAQLRGGGHVQGKEPVTVIHGKANSNSLEVVVDELTEGKELGRWTFARRTTGRRPSTGRRVSISR